MAARNNKLRRLIEDNQNPKKGGPKVITLIGSTKFQEEFEIANLELSKQGHAVFTVCVFGHRIGMDMAGPVKKILDKGYMLKIARSDAVLVLNKDGYIGMGACDEIHWALALGKEIMWLEEPPTWREYLNGVSEYV